MAKKIGRRVTRYLNSSALNKPWIVLGAASALVGPVTSAHALDASTLPQDPTLAGGNATFAQSGKTLNVTQTSNRAVIDWRSFNIGSEAQTNFNQPNSGSIAVNRVNASANPTQIEGGLHANGQVWILNPNGVMFGKTAHVDAAGIVASTANIDTTRFMAGDNRLNLTGADKGSVVNDGSITVGKNGLAAFVAPSVRNSGTITARVGKVALAAGTTFTLDLAGDRLVEIGLGAGKAVVDQSGKIVNPGGTVTLTARAAGQVVDSVVNMSGVTRTASARKVGGDIVLDGDTVNVAGTADASGTSGGNIAITGKTITVASNAVLRSDAASNGDGGTIKAVAAGQGTYAGSYSAKGGSASGNGGKIETSGQTVNVAADVKIDASATHGNAGAWLLDPLDVTISNGTGGGLTGATVTTGAIQTTLAGGTSVSITTDQTGGDAGDLTLAGSINANSTGGAGLTLSGRHLSATGGSTINIAGGALTLNVNAVNALADTSNQPTNWIQDADNMVGTVTGSTIKLGAGTYAAGATVDRSHLVLDGSAGAVINVNPGNAQVIGLGIGGGTSGVTIKGFTINGEITGSYVDYTFGAGSSRGIAVVQGATGFTVNSNTIRNLRTGILVDGRNVSASAITNNLIDNTKTAVFLQYTAGEGINISGNRQGQFGNEWGGNFHVNGDYNGTTLITAPGGDAPTNVQSALMADSAANAGWAVQDQAYATSNRTMVVVDPTGTDANQGSPKAKLATIQAGIAAVTSGGTVNVDNGTYVTNGYANGYLNVNKALRLVGQSQAGTIIDAQAAAQYGLRVTADNVSLSNFTLLGVSGASNSYGIKVENQFDAAGLIHNLSISNVTSHGARKAQLDMSGVVGGTIDHFTADGTSNGSGSGSQAGAGIAISDSANITITNSSTNNNAYGGLALYETNTTRTQQVTGITVAANNTFNEVTPVYMEDSSANVNFGAVNIAGFNYTVADPSTPTDLFTFFQKTQQGALDYAAARNATATSVQGWTGTAGNNIFTVGTSSGGTALSIQAAVNAASSGATVNVLNGTYVIPGTGGNWLEINKSLSLIGQSQGGTTIDGSGGSGYGMRVEADNVTLSNFTLLGATGVGNFGLKVQPVDGSSAGSRINNFNINNVTINGSYKSALDITAATNATIDRVTAENATHGVGIAIVDSANVALTNSTTLGNAWGGMRIEEKNSVYDQQTKGISVAASNTFNEATPLYMEDDSASLNFGAVNIAGFNYAIGDASNASDLVTAFQNTTQQGALDYAAAHNAASASVQGWTGTVGNNIFTVGTSTGGTVLSIQAAVNAANPGATVNVLSGIYGPNVNINKSNLSLIGAAGAEIDFDPGNAEVRAITVSGGDGVTISGFKIRGEISGSYINYAFGSGKSEGVYVVAGATNVTISGNDIQNVRTGILIDGYNSGNYNTGSITNNLIDNTKGAVAIQWSDANNNAAHPLVISGNSQGTFGNEWGVNFHLQGPHTGAAPIDVQQALLANSAANAGWAVQDQAYASSNRTVVFVNTTGSDTNQGSARAKLASIQAGISAAVTGGNVNVDNGTYVISNSAPYINVNKSLTLTGQSQAGTIIDARNANTYGLRISGPNSNVTLQNFTLYGVTSGTFQYGLKAENVTNLTLRNITSRGAGKSEFDLNGIIGATLDNLTANGASVATGLATAGNGIAFTDSQNIALTNSKTMNNAWGGLALYQSNFTSGFTYQLKNITVDGSNNFAEANAIYAEDQSAANDIGALTLAGFNYVVQSAGATNDVYAWFQKSQQNAVDFAAATSAANASVQGYAGNGETGNNIFTVGTSTGGTAMSVQAAVNAASTGATVNVLGGTYAVPTTLGITKSLALVGQSQAGTILNASGATTYSLRVQADNVSLSNFTLMGSTVSGAYGIKVEPLNLSDPNSRINNFAISNVTINGSNKSALDINGAHLATINNVTAKNAAAGVGIAIVDSSNVTVTNSTTQNNAWGGVRIEEKNAASNGINQQTTAVSVDASNTLNEATPLYLEDDSTSLNFGAITVGGFDYMIADPSNAGDLFTAFQKTQQGAVNYAAARNAASAYVQGWTGTAGNNIFTVGTGSNSAAMSIPAAVNAASSGATVNVLNGTYVIPGGGNWLEINKSLSLIGQSQAGTIINGSGAAGYGLRVEADNVSLSNFTLMGATGSGSFGLKVQPLDGSAASARINNFAIRNVTINGSNKSALDITAATNATIDHVTAENAANGVGIALINSANVAVTNSTTLNNAWGGVRIEQKNSPYTQQTTAVSVDASNTLNETVPLYMEDDSSSLNFGTVAVGGLGFVVRAPSDPTDAFTFFQKTQQGAVNYAAGLNLASAYVEGWSGSDVNNIFTVGISSGGTTLSLQSALNAATSGATVNMLSGSYAGNIVGNGGTNFNFGTVSLGGSFTLNGASTLSGNLSASSIALNGAVTLAGATTLNTSAANGSIRTSAIDGSTAGGQALTINSGTGAVSLGSLGGTTRLGAVSDTGATLLVGSTYNANSLSFGGLTLGFGTTLNTSAANGAIVTGSINGFTAGIALTVNAGSGTASLGSLGVTTRLGAVSDSSATTLTGGTYNAASLSFGALTLTTATTLNTVGSIVTGAINGTTAGGQALTISDGSGTVSLGSLGATTRLGAVNDNRTATTTLNGSTYNANSMNFGGALLLTAATTLNTSAAGGNIVTNAINGSTAGGQALTISSGTGEIFLGPLGAITRLGAVSDTGVTTLTGTTYNANSLNFGGALTLAAATALNTSAANGAIVTGSINGTTVGGQALTVNAGGGAVSLGSLGASTRLGAVSDSSGTTLTGTTYNANSLSFGGLTLTSATALNTSAANGAIVAATINGTTAGGQALTILSGSGAVLLGSLGVINRLGAVSDSGATTLAGGIYNANSLSFGALTLALEATLNTSATGGNIVTNAVNGSTAGGQALTVNAGSGTVSLGSLGAGTRLGAFTDASATTLTGSTYNANSLNFASDVTLTAATTTMDTSPAAGNITVSGNIFGTTNGAQNLVLAAGPGTGSVAANGNILVQSVGVKGILALGDMTVSGNNFGAQTVSVGNFKAKLTGNQVFSSHTLNATSVDSTVGGSASGPINSAGAVGLAVTGDVTGAIVGHAVVLNAGSITGATVTGTDTISVTANSVGTSTLSAPTVSATAVSFNSDVNASNVTLNAGTIDGSTITGSQNINVTATNVGTSTFTAPTVAAKADSFNSAVNASSAANISGGNVAGTFTGGSFTLTGSNSVNATVSAKSATVSSSAISGSYSGDAVSLSGSSSVNATVASNNLSVQSPSGKLAGTWASLDTGGSGTLVVNNQTSVGSGATNPNQIVVENFVLPTGTRVTPSGAIVLPQGLMIGLLSPGGGNSAPKLIQVQDVYSLGSLLSSGYTAIIIDLSGHTKTDDKAVRVSMN